MKIRDDVRNYSLLGEREAGSPCVARAVFTAGGASVHVVPCYVSKLNRGGVSLFLPSGTPSLSVGGGNRRERTKRRLSGL